MAIKGQGPVAAVSHGLAHQFMCAAAMVGGHVAANYNEVVMQVVMHPVTNVAMMGMAAWCWFEGDKSWLKRRGELAASFEKVSMRSLMAAAGLGMMIMHIPGQSHYMMNGEMQSRAEADAWLAKQSPEMQENIRDGAGRLKMPVDEYIQKKICGQKNLPPEPRGIK